MPNLTIRKQDVDAVRIGARAQLIRRTRKTPIKVGDKLLFYSGTYKKDNLIGESICTRADAISFNSLEAQINGRNIPAADAERLAVCEGFFSWPELLRWFAKNYSVPFGGTLVQWVPLKAKL